MQHRIKTIFCLSYLMMAGFSHADEIKASEESVNLNIGGSLIVPMCTLRSVEYNLGEISVARFSGQYSTSLLRIRSTGDAPLEDCSVTDRLRLSLDLQTQIFVATQQNSYGYVPLEAVEGRAQGVHLYLEGYSEGESRENFQRFVDDSAKGLYLYLDKETRGGQVTPGKISGKVKATLTRI